MKFFQVLTAIILAGSQLIIAQDITDCTDIAAGLNTLPIIPVTVPDLPVCVDQRDSPQCCSAQFIQEQQGLAEQNFLQGLRTDLRERFQQFESIVDQLRTYFEGDFLTGYFASIGDIGFLRRSNRLIREFIADLRSHIDFQPGDDDEDDDFLSRARDRDNTNRFNVRRFLGEVVLDIEDEAVEQFAGQLNESDPLVQCIRQVIEGQVQRQQTEIQAANLQQVRRASAAFENLRGVIYNFTADLAGFRPLQQCIDTVVRLNTCERCVAVRPPFCENVCEAIASACYSPFNDALEDELEDLWEVAREILDAAVDAIEDLNANRGILNRTVIVAHISTDCNIDVSPVRAGRQIDLDDDEVPRVPQAIRAAVRALRGGPFDYDGRDVDGSGFCRLLNTRSNNCWDGSENRTDDIDDFDDDDIIDQDNNPVIRIPRQLLIEQSASLGAPISDALSDPSFVNVAPVGLVFPGTDINSEAAATATFLSFSSLTLLLIICSLLV